MRAWAATLLVVGGCSFALAREPELPTAHDDEVDCTRSYAVPAGDLVVAAGVSGLAFASMREEHHPQSPGAGTAIAALIGTGLLVATIELASATWGFVAVTECRSADRQLQRLKIQHAQRTQRASELAMQASAAARASNCVRVRELAEEIEEVDPDVYDVVFAPASDLAACLSD